MRNQTRFWTILSGSLVTEIEQGSIARSWPANSVIFRQGDHCEGLHVIQHGLVKVYVASSNGREQTIALQRTSSPISFVPVLDRGVYATTARTVLPTRTLFLPLSTFDELVATRAEFRQAVFSEAARMLRGVISLADSMALKTVPSRVAMLLLEEANRMQPEGITGEFRLKLTQEDVAGIVGATRESVSRALAQLRASGIIEQHGARIRILDPDALGYCAQNGVAAELTQPVAVRLS